jgi:hypothetical protein
MKEENETSQVLMDPIYGCKNPKATNYNANPKATETDSNGDIQVRCFIKKKGSKTEVDIDTQTEKDMAKALADEIARGEAEDRAAKKKAADDAKK